MTPGVLERRVCIRPPAHAEVPAATTGRRLALANWIANRDESADRARHGQSHLGLAFRRGIAANPNNFGKMGERPTHPELLDWLAGYFIEHGWSVKEMHRVMMLSDAYQRTRRRRSGSRIRTIAGCSLLFAAADGSGRAARQHSGRSRAS